MPLLKILPSLISQGPFTGSFSGTSSYARRSLTASYVMGGAAGSSGTSGANGSVGSSGSSGQSGTSGSSGTSGINGTSGSSGTSATAGSSGTSGVGSPGTSGTAGSSGTSSTATLQTGSIASQTLWTNVKSGSTNTITGLSLSSNKWNVSVVEEWDAKIIPGDQYYNSCSLLMHFNGVNGSTTFTDNSPSPKTVTSVNGAAISTVQSKFGGASGFFDGSDDYLTVPDNSAFDFGTGDFTIEYWEYRTSNAVFKPGISRNSSGQPPWMVGWTESGNINFFAGNGSSWSIASAVSMGVIIINSWTHYAVTRQGNTFRTFQNGTQISTFTSTATIPNGAAPLEIGRYAATYYYPGYLDELRLTKGVARYTGNFTPENSQFYNNRSLYQSLTKYIGTVGGLNDTNVDYGVQKLNDSSLKVVKMTTPGNPSSGSLSASIDRVYVNVIDYTKVSVTSSYATNALTASYILGGGANGSSGTSGNNGTSGTSGTSSTAGSSGTSGQSGTSATAGSSGSSGNSGTSGTSGATGASGTSGSSGSSGTSGTTGSSGTSATAGSSGTSGVGSPGTSGTAGSSGTSSTAIVQTGSLAKQTILYNVTSGSTNTITGLSLGGNKWDVSVVEEWDAINGDLFYNSSSLLMHFSGSNGSTTFIDNSPSVKTVTSNNGAAISSLQSKFGNRSGLFDGVDDYLSISGNTVCNFGSSNFTVECWVRLNAMPTSDAWPTNYSSHFIVITVGTVNLGDGIGFIIGQTKLIVQNNDSQIINATHGMATNIWYHIAYVRSGNTLYLFVNGTQIGSTASFSSAVGTGATTYIGCETGQGAFFNGYMDELRVTKGIARYTNNFTAPSAEFGNVRGQVATKYIGSVGGLNDRSVDYGVQKLSDSSLRIVKMSIPGLPYPAISGSLSGSVDRVYVNVLDYTKVSVTSSYSLLSKTASYALNASGGSTLRTGSLYPITSSWSRRALTASYALNASGGGSTLRTGSRYPITASRAITASYALNGGTALVNQTMNYVSGSNLYVLSRSVVSPSDVLLSVNGIIQTPITDYTVSASRVTFTESYPSGSKINARYLVTATNSSDVNLANIVLTGTTTGDAYYPQVSALLHFDGTNGSTTITDNSKNNVTFTVNGNSQISTAQSKFGGASILFDGTGDYISSPSTSDLAFGTGDFTIECWAYKSAGSNNGILQISSTSGGLQANSTLNLSITSFAGTIGIYANNSSYTSTAFTNTTNVWYHYAIVRNNGITKFYFNGNLVTDIGTSGAITDTTNYTGTYLAIGGYYSTSYLWNGYIDELRITNGYARYTGNFTPSTTAFSNTGGDVGKALVVNSTATGVSIGTAGFNLNSSNINRIINGAMTIDQRNAGAAQTITAAAALAYTVDRWYAYCTGANVTGQRITGSANNQYAYRFTGAASVTAIGFGQRIEAANSIDLAGSTATLGVDLANSVLTSVTWTAYYANTSDTFGTLASPTRTQISTGTFTVNSTLSRYSTQIFIPSAATTGIEIVFSVGAQTSGTWTIDNVQLEAGPLATPFERRLIGTELVNCQRYCYSLTTAVGTNYFLAPGSFGGTTFGFIGFNLPQIMRTIPILSSAVTAGNYQVYIPNGGTYQTLTSLALNAVSTNNFILFQFGIAGGGTAGQVCYLNAPSTTIPVILTSEL
jgi:hypothetical protein